MSKTFTFERFDLPGWACDECGGRARPQSEFDGEWVRAEDAINREAVNADAIRTLELHLKEAQRAVASLKGSNAGEAAMQRACAELPFGYDMRVCLEEGAGGIELFDPHGETVAVAEDMDGGMTPRIIDAIERAIEHAKESK
jgi:hypothetical protein